jgi:hypothetical protein
VLTTSNVAVIEEDPGLYVFVTQQAAAAKALR